MRLILLALLALGVVGCDAGKSSRSKSAGSAQPWYAPHFNHPLSAGQKFHSEINLPAGTKTELTISAKEAIVIGFTLEKGYDIFKSKGSVWLGTPTKPHTAGGAPGVSDKFVPENGVVSLIVENGSSVDTRVAIYTQDAETR